MRQLREIPGRRVCAVMMALLMLVLPACSDGGTQGTVMGSIAATTTQSIVKATEATTAPLVQDAPILLGLGEEYLAGAMFALYFGKPERLGTAAAVIDSHDRDLHVSNFSFCLIPLRDSVAINIEGAYEIEAAFSDPPYTPRAELNAKLGEFYIVNGFADHDEGYENTLVHIVARDGDEQGVFLLNALEFSGDDPHVVYPATAAQGLAESKIRLFSGMAAGAVWQYGQKLGWIDEYGECAAPITPQQLAVSRAAVEDAIQTAVAYTPDPEEAAAACMAAVFPGVKTSALPKSDPVSASGEALFHWADNTRILLNTPSADGKGGHVIVSISWEGDYGVVDNFYRVDWEADGPYDVYRPFSYKLTGVQPLMRYMLRDRPYDEFVKQYITPDLEAALKGFGLTHPMGYLSTYGVHGAGTTLFFILSGEGEREHLEDYALLDDDGETVTYLGAAGSFTPLWITLQEHDYSQGSGTVYVPDGWVDLGILCLPEDWQYEVHILNDLTIEGTGSSGAPLTLWAGWLMADSVESTVASAGESEPFVFNDGHVGYMLFFDGNVMWLRNDWMSLQLQHGGDVLLYTEKPVLDVARTLTIPTEP